MCVPFLWRIWSWPYVTQRAKFPQNFCQHFHWIFLPGLRRQLPGKLPLQWSSPLLRERLFHAYFAHSSISGYLHKTYFEHAFVKTAMFRGAVFRHHKDGCENSVSRFESTSPHHHLLSSSSPLGHHPGGLSRELLSAPSHLGLALFLRNSGDSSRYLLSS